MNIDDLTCRHWTSEHIRGYCIVLARCGCPLLTDLEPLHLIRENSPEGALLWTWYNVAVGLPDVAMTAVELAREKWPGDERLREMRDFIADGATRL